MMVKSNFLVTHHYIRNKANVTRFNAGTIMDNQIGPAQEVQRPDLWATVAQGAPPDEDLSDVVIKELDLQNQHWQEKVSQTQDVTVCILTMAILLKSPHASDIIEVTSLMYGRLRQGGKIHGQTVLSVASPKRCRSHQAEGESMFLKEEHVCLLWILPKLKPIFARWRYVMLQNIGFENNWRLLVFDCLG